jgi:FKBP-type peptidyl-prolyl cis-trans isomerase 2
MAEAKSGDTVRVKFTGTLEDGTKFDTTDGRDPMEFILGAGQVIAGFDEAVVGMALGEVKKIVLSPEQAYGMHDPEIVDTVPRKSIPAEIKLAEGLVLEATGKDGEKFGFTVVDFDEEMVTLDANHPLAGEALNFDIELVEIK